MEFYGVLNYQLKSEDFIIFPFIVLFIIYLSFIFYLEYKKYKRNKIFLKQKLKKLQSSLEDINQSIFLNSILEIYRDYFYLINGIKKSYSMTLEELEKNIKNKKLKDSFSEVYFYSYSKNKLDKEKKYYFYNKLKKIIG